MILYSLLNNTFELLGLEDFSLCEMFRRFFRKICASTTLPLKILMIQSLITVNGVKNQAQRDTTRLTLQRATEQDKTHRPCEILSLIFLDYDTIV